MSKYCFNDILYVSDGRIRRADIVVEDEYIARITDKEEYSSLKDIAVGAKGTTDEAFTKDVDKMSDDGLCLLLPGVIDEHVHTREPGLTHKGDLTTETHAAAAGGVTSIMDMPNVVPQTTNLEALAERRALGAAHAFVNYSFYFGATNTNAHLLPQLDPTKVPAVKLFMGSSTGGMLVDRGEALRDVFASSPLPVMTHCEDSDIIARNLREAQARYGDDPAVVHHAEIRSREACVASSRLAARLAHETGARLHIAHVTTAEELSLADKNITLEACVPHLLFTDEDYATLGTRIKCNPAVKTAADRSALRAALSDGLITTVATDHAPHLLSEKEGGCRRAASGMPMVQFSLPAMLELMEEDVLSVERLVDLMCHRPAMLFDIRDRGFVREGMKADLTIVQRQRWTLTAEKVVSRCAWSPLEGRTLTWQVAQTYCNGRLIFDRGVFAKDNIHAQELTFRA
ncbi:MAG: amidohydrolase family protein [Bacteroidales bacterium]|nr:amidohydrolase family protein [Bacteroidales bacterium]